MRVRYSVSQFTLGVPMKNLSFLHTKKRLWLHVSLLTHFNQPLTINNTAALTSAWQKKILTYEWYNDAQVYSPIATCYFGGARSKGFAMLRNVSKLPFFDKIGQAKSVGFRFYSAIWRSESRISSRYLEITSISLIHSLTFSRKKELLFWLSRDLNRLTCVTRQIRGDFKLRN